MTTTSLEPLLQEHGFFRGLQPELIQLLVECARTVRFQPGELIFRQGEEANHFYLLQTGRVAVEMSVPAKQPLVIQTLTAHDVLGWSWLFPPYRWQFDAQALESTQAIALDGRCLRGKCDTNLELGYTMMQRFSLIMLAQLQAAQLQLLDLYAPPRRRQNHE